MDPQADHVPSVRSRAPLARGSRPREAHTVRWPSPRPGARRLHLRSRSRARLWFRLRAGPWPCGLGLPGAKTIASRGFTGQGPTGVRRRRLSLRESFTPTRSARAPPVARSLLHRLETPMSPDATCQRSSRITAVHDHAARPDPREGSGSCALDGPLARGRRAGESQGPLRPGWRERHPGPRAVSPTLPRRRAGSTAPEVPSIDEPARLQPISRSLSAGGPRSACGAILSRGLELSTGCHQPGDNTCAFGDPVRSAALDGAAWTMNG
jgi:hypothetical protein